MFLRRGRIWNLAFEQHRKYVKMCGIFGYGGGGGVDVEMDTAARR